MYNEHILHLSVPDNAIQASPIMSFDRMHQFFVFKFSLRTASDNCSLVQVFMYSDNELPK